MIESFHETQNFWGEPGFVIVWSFTRLRAINELLNLSFLHSAEAGAYGRAPPLMATRDRAWSRATAYDHKRSHATTQNHFKNFLKKWWKVVFGCTWLRATHVLDDNFGQILHYLHDFVRSRAAARSYAAMRGHTRSRAVIHGRARSRATIRTRAWSRAVARDRARRVYEIKTLIFPWKP